MRKIVINGSIFSAGLHIGVPRFSFEILKELDVLPIAKEIEIVSPITLDYSFQNINVLLLKPELYERGRLFQEYWRQKIYIDYINSGDCVSVDPGIMLPWKRNDIVFVYDCQPEKWFKSYLTKPYSFITKRIRLLVRRHAIQNAKQIICDSYSAKHDVMEVFGVPDRKIQVIYAGWQHYKDIVSDDSVFDILPTKIKRGEFFFSLGSRYRHKNIEWIFAAAKQNPEFSFVCTGANNVADYSDDIEQSAPPNVFFTGYLTDEKVKALMENCRAFIQPSLSEGFGIPPLEAMSCGAEIIISNVTSLPEVYGEYAHYIDPYNYESIDLNKILASSVGDPQELLSKYSWQRSARELAVILDDFLGRA